MAIWSVIVYLKLDSTEDLPELNVSVSCIKLLRFPNRHNLLNSKISIDQHVPKSTHRFLFQLAIYLLYSKGTVFLPCAVKGMDIAFLGTGSGYPTPNRGASAIAFRYEGDVWLVDCGEGTQTQIMKFKVIKPGNISKIFITHLHGDHMFGLPGLLCTISMAFNPIDCDTDVCELAATPNTIEIFGPLGLRRFLREALNLSRSVLVFKYVVHELIPVQPQYRGSKHEDMDWNVWNPDHIAKGPPHPSEMENGRAIFQDKVTGQWPLCCTNHITATAGMLKHRIPSFGYVFSEAPKAGKLNSEKLIKFGVPKGPLFGKIKNGEQVTLSDGRRVNPSDFIGPTQPGRKIAILQDTCDSWSMQDACYRCDILIHEATNENSHEEKCVANGHSTPRMAAEFASAVQAQMLIQSHCSQRYKDPKQHAVSEGDATVETLTQEAQLKYDGPVVTAYDGLVMNVKRKIVDT